MQFQKLNGLIHSPYSSSNVSQILRSLYDHLRKQSNQLYQLTNSVHKTKLETMTILGGKISLSEFPILLEKYTHRQEPDKQAQIMKKQLEQLTFKVQANKEFNKIFDKGSFKQYEMRSLQEMIIGNQQYIKGAINELIINKADRTELQRLYALNDRFDSQLSNLSKGVIELAKNPSPFQGKHSQLLSKYEQVKQQIKKETNQLKQKCLKFQVNSIQLNTKIKNMEQNIAILQQSLVDQRQQHRKKIGQSLEYLQNSSQQIQRSILDKIMLSVHDTFNTSSYAKQQLSELTEQVNKLKKQVGKFNKKQLVDLIERHIVELKEQTIQQSDDQQQDITMIKQQILRLDRRIQIDIKDKKQIIQKQISMLKRDLQSKMTPKDIERIVAKLTTIEETKQIVLQQLKKFEETNIGTIKDFVDDQIIINEALCSQNMIGRWYWNGGDLKNGNLIPWQKQVINTSPQSYVWSQGTTQLILINQGLYRIELGVFSDQKKKPSIQVILNGNNIMSAVNNSSYVIHHSSGRLKQNNGSKSSKGISGITLVDFLCIPAKSRLAISFVGDCGRGFLAFKKL